VGDGMTADRAATIRGLRALVDFLESHPDLPLPIINVGMQVYPRSRQSIEDVSEMLEVGTREENDCLETSRHFGGGVSYQATWWEPARLARSEARYSYVTNVQVSA
jgi:hypothetical protein